MITWVMRTVNREVFDPPRRNYLGQTLAALARSWGTSAIPIHLVDSRSEDDRWIRALAPDLTWAHYHGTPVRRTNNENALRVLEIGLAGGTPWIVHLEDDLEVCADLPGSITRWLTRYATPDRHLFTFHTPYAQVGRRAAAGHHTWDYPIGAFYGNQCWAMRREDAIGAVEYLTYLIPKWRSGQGFDLMLKQWATETWPTVTHFLASCPSFVQHVGEESTLHLGRFHQNGSFPGTAWRFAP